MYFWKEKLGPLNRIIFNKLEQEADLTYIDIHSGSLNWCITGYSFYVFLTLQ